MKIKFSYYWCVWRLSLGEKKFLKFIKTALNEKLPLSFRCYWLLLMREQDSWSGKDGGGSST